MSLLKPPTIDSRTGADIAEQTRQLIGKFLGWDSTADGGEAGKALSAIFAHLCAQVVDRINRAPEKNFLAFLDLLGNTLAPAVPSRVPLSFTLSSSAVEGVLLPIGTRLFAPPPTGASEPIYFETEEDLWLTNLDLQSFLKAVDTNAYANLTASINHAGATDEALFLHQDQTYYFGFALPEPRKLPAGLALAIYLEISSPAYQQRSAIDAESTDVKTLEWEYSSSANHWNPLSVEDHTQLLSISGKILFQIPDDFSLLEIQTDKIDPKTTIRNYWIRVKAKDNKFNRNPAYLKWLTINTVTALQASSIGDEILGSSTGNPGQIFNSFRYPVLSGQRLEIREKSANTNSQQPAQEGWQLWQEVPDFYASTAADRHYVLDHDSGKISFGNGQNGMIPPPGVRNIRMESYRYGGGRQGNVPAGAVTNFWAPLSLVDKVINYSPASGGSDVESYESLLERAPKVLRHRNRAVTESDYEDLAKMASAEVAIARCIPLTDLAEDPYQDVDEKKGVGKVSLIIVPKTADADPTPSLSLLKQVKDTIMPLAPSIATLSVVGPLYLQVNTSIQVRVRAILVKDTVEKTLKMRLAEFLHPLTGRGGAGWAFGRVPHESDLYPLLKTVDGIEYVEAVNITFLNSHGVDKTLKTKRFLIFSGDHMLTIKTRKDR